MYQTKKAPFGGAFCDPARITVENGVITTKASFNIDRLKWGMNSYNDPEAELHILPEVEIKLDIKAAK